MKTRVNVAVGIILNAVGEIFIAERLEHQSKAGYWEFPGGKIEATESVFDALCRELNEETGILVSSAEPLLVTCYETTVYEIILDTWLVKKYSGEPFGKEGQKTQWISLDKLKNVEFPRANDPIIHKLKEVLHYIK